MVRPPFRLAALSVAILATFTVARAEEAAPLRTVAHTAAPAPVKQDFLSRFLAPQLTLRLAADRQAAIDLGSRTPNPWAQDSGTTARVQRGALRAARGALKDWAVERLSAQMLAFPIPGRGASGPAGQEHAAVRLGFAHATPRAELSTPFAGGRFRFSADLRGRLGTGFETAKSGVHFGVTLDPLRHDATVGFTKSF